jgi:WD40 repeat protein
LQGYRLFAAVVNDLFAYDYETGSQLFRVSYHSKLVSMDMRQDTPSIVAGNKDKEIVILSVRQGSLGKVLDILKGHEAEINHVRIDHSSHICYSLDADNELICWNVDQHILLYQQNLVAKKTLEETKMVNPWCKVEITPAACRFLLDVHCGVPVMLVHTSDHQESLVDIECYQRFLGNVHSPSPVIWMRCITSAGLLQKLMSHHCIEIPGVDDNLLLIVSLDGTIQIMHSFTGDILAIIPALHLHDAYVGAKSRLLQELSDEKLGGRGGHAVAKISSSGNDIFVHGARRESLENSNENNLGKTAAGKKGANVALPRSGREKTTEKEGQSRGKRVSKNCDSVKVQKLIDSFMKKSGVDRTEDDKNERKGKDQGQRAFKKKICSKNTEGALGTLLFVDYLEDLSTSHESKAGLLMLAWTGGSIDLINLEAVQCVQIFQDRDIDTCRPTSAVFFPQKHVPEEHRSLSLRSGSFSLSPSLLGSFDVLPCATSDATDATRTSSPPLNKQKYLLPEQLKPHFAVTGNSNGMIKIWTPSTVTPPAVTHKFKPMSLTPTLDSGAILGVSCIEQTCPNSGVTIFALLTASAKGCICLFRAYTWEPLAVAQVPNIPNVTGVSNVQHDLKMLGLFSPQLALMTYNDGDVQAWCIELTSFPNTDTLNDMVSSKNSKMPRTASSTSSKAAQELKVLGHIYQVWPPAHQEDSNFHFGQGCIIDMHPEENRFTSKSSSTGLLEWHVEVSEKGDKLEVSLLYGDQFSRFSDLQGRMQGKGELRTGTVTSCYVKSINSGVFVLCARVRARERE